jgi:hypothetical protein
MSRAVLLLPLALATLPAQAPPPPGRGEAAIARAFAAYKFPGPPPAPLRRAREDWDAARARLARDPAYAKWVTDVGGRARSWRRQHADKAGWIAGWGHDLVDPARGTPLSWTWAMAEPPAGTKPHGAWVFYVRQTNIQTVLDCARLWRIRDTAEDRDWAAAQLDLYAAAYEHWPVQTLNGRSRLFGQSLDEAVAATQLVEAARLLAPAVDKARVARWNDGLFRPMLREIQASNRGENNIAVWQAAAAAILALHLGQEADYARAIEGAGGIRPMLARGVTPDYLWFEPSVAYGAYTQGALATLFTAASLAGRAGPLRREMLLTQAMVASQAAMRFADGTLPALGDSAPGTQAFDASLIAATQRTMPLRAPVPPPNWSTLLDPGIPTAPPPAEAGSRHWPDAQATMLRRAGWELFFHYGQRSASHAQGDALSWELRHRGIPIIAPAGVAAYGSKLFLDYLRTSAAHAMPLVDGTGQVAFGPGTLGAWSPDSVTAANPGIRGASVTRTVALGEGAMVERTVLRTDGAAKRLGIVLNTPCRVMPAAPLSPASAPAGPGFGWWRDVRASAAAPRWTAGLDCGGTRFRLAIAGDAPGRMFVGAAPDRTGAMTRTGLYFEAKAPALTVSVRIAPG